jgi:hypothetical protein
MSKPETMMIDDVKYVRADSINNIADPVDGMQYCIIRCRNAGVHAGFVKERNGAEVTLLQSRRLWKWFGKTLSGLALYGTDDSSRCKFADELPEITVLDACEVIPCTEKAINSLRGVAQWEND